MTLRARIRASHSSWYGASDPGTTTGPKPCMPPMSWTPSTRGTILQPMPHYDLPLADLRNHRCGAPPPADLDDYWQRALGVARSRVADPVYEPYEEAAYGSLAVDDVT